MKETDSPKRWYIVQFGENHVLDQVETWHDVELQIGNSTKEGGDVAVQVWDVFPDRAVLHMISPFGTWKPSDPLPDKPLQVTKSYLASDKPT